MKRTSVLLVLCLLANGCAGKTAAVPASVSLTQGAGLTARDDIDGLDIATDARGDVHLVWGERSNVYGGGTVRARLVYRHGSGSPLRWGPRVVVAEGGIAIGSPQVVVASDRVHVFAGARMQHWWWPVAGGAPISDGTVLAGQDPAAGGFDAIQTADAILIAYLATDASDDQTLRAVRWRPAGPGRVFEIARLPRAASAGRVAPQFHRLGPRLMLAWPQNSLQQRWDPGINATSVSTTATIHSTSSSDGGATWTAVRDVITGNASPITALALAGTAEIPSVLFATSGLFESRLVATGWTPPGSFNGDGSPSPSNTGMPSAVATTRCNGHGVVAWVDARHRRSDRRWWNPLGGLPWGDNPDGYNNDLFVAKYAPPLAGTAAARVPRRLTSPDSFTRQIVVAEHDGQLLVLRTGRARVRKAPNDAGSPPEITQVTVPCG